MAHRRDLREHQRFTEEISALGDWARLDDALVGVCTCISQKAEIFEEIPGFGGKVRIARSMAFGSIPAFRLLFTIVDENVVELLSIARAEENDADNSN